ncbi:MAG: PQQ-dependent dehydrogenase, methanol/ethanol family [Proteobacteria bacterium]|nr:PQQ-dependent dehydrogenase, methanol/ethanol family [Pseudomonadota bacterium]
MTRITFRIGLVLLAVGIGACQAKRETAPATAPARPPAATVDAARIARAASEPDQWLMTGRDQGGTYFSPLADINASNVARLGYAWEYRLGTRRGLEATPVVVDGALYVTGNFGWVYAVDAATGRELWKYNPEVDGQWGRYACCDAINRGVAVYQGRVYVGTLDGYLHAIDAATGERLWKVDTLPARGPKAPYTLSATPVVAGDVVVVGSAGADFAGARGYVAAFDRATGAFRWRFYTVPRNPKEGPQDQPHLVEAIKTWDPRHRWDAGSGGTAWDGMSYDPELKLVYFGTANGAPYNIKEGGRKGGDDLYTAAIVAVHADSGTLAWYYQTTPGDRWDYDSTQKLVLADLELADGPHKVIMQASKNGFYYVLDRATGKLLSANNYVFVNWTKGIDPKTGRPMVRPEAEYNQQPRLMFPANAGAHSWQPMSYDPQTKLTYIPTIEWPMIYKDTGNTRAGLIEGFFTVQAFLPDDYDPKALKSLYGPMPSLAELDHGLPPPHARGFLRAWDPVHQKLAWEVPTVTHWDGGVLSTGGGLVFQGDAAGNLNVYAAADGKKLASVAVGTGIMAAPATYRLNGVQYVVVMAGFGGNYVNYPLTPEMAAYHRDNEGRIVAFRLDGGAVPLPAELPNEPFPQPPPREGSAAVVGNGEVLYNRFCSRCHMLDRGVLPDLRRLTAAKHELFYEIVLNGALAGAGMGRWDDVLSRKDAEAIHAYIVSEAWKAYEAQQSH